MSFYDTRYYHVLPKSKLSKLCLAKYMTAINHSSLHCLSSDYRCERQISSTSDLSNHNVALVPMLICCCIFHVLFLCLQKTIHYKEVIVVSVYICSLSECWLHHRSVWVLFVLLSVWVLFVLSAMYSRVSSACLEIHILCAYVCVTCRMLHQDQLTTCNIQLIGVDKNSY